MKLDGRRESVGMNGKNEDDWWVSANDCATYILIDWGFCSFGQCILLQLQLPAFGLKQVSSLIRSSFLSYGAAWDVVEMPNSVSYSIELTMSLLWMT